MSSLIYLASPYSDPDPKVRKARWTNACRITGILMLDGNMMFSPIAYSHPIAVKIGLPVGWEYWSNFDRKMISHCSLLLVATIKGWRESVGVAAEIKIAGELGVPVKYICPSDLKITDEPPKLVVKKGKKVQP